MSETPAATRFQPEAADVARLMREMAAAESADHGFDLLCGWVVANTGWQRAAFVKLQGSGLVTGQFGLPPEVAERVRHRGGRISAQERDRNRARVLAGWRIADDLDVIFVPVEKRANLPRLVVSAGDEAGGPGGEHWQPGDELCLLPHDDEGRFLGQLCLAAPEHGLRPGPQDHALLRDLLEYVRAAAELMAARERAFDRGQAEARRVLEYVESLTSLVSMDELLDRIAELCARIAGFRTSLLSIRMDDGSRIGSWNIPQAELARFRENSAQTPSARKAAKLEQIRRYRLGDTQIAFIPHDADVMRSSAFTQSPGGSEGAWHPEDRLFILVRSGAGHDIGVLCLDAPLDGQVPSSDTLGPLRVAERFLQLGTALVEGRVLEAHLVRARRIEALGNLAAGVAHDFNNLVGVMMGYASLLTAELRGQANLLSMAEAIEKAARRAGDLTDRLRAITRAPAGERRELDLLELISDCVATARSTFDRRIEISTQFPDSLAQVLGDVGQLTRAIMNVLINSRDAMPDGGSLRVRVEEDVAPGILLDGESTHWVAVEIADTGTGIDDRHVDRVFEPFFSTKSKDEGSGLGLFQTYNTLKSHGGTVQIGRRPDGGGTLVSIRLPALTSRTRRPTEAPAQAAPLTREALASAQPARILAVEDEPALQALLRDSLSVAGHTVEVVGDGEAAIQRIDEGLDDVDLIVLDLFLPKRSGVEVFHHLRDSGHAIPVLVSSGNVEEGLQDARLRNGVAGVLRKPWRLQDLLGAAEQALSDSRPRSDA